MKKIFALLLALAVIITCFTACGGNKADDATAIESITLDGEKVTADAFKGNKLTVVNVWGTFCGPCINEMPDLGKISRDYADKGVVLIGIVADVYDYYKNENNPDKIEDAKDIVAQTGVTYMNVLPSESLNAAGLDYISTFPTTYFLNENGEIIGEYVGSRSYESWSSLIDMALQS